MNINQSEYWKEVKTTAENIAEMALEESEWDRDEAEEYINDTLLHETVDGHEWIIYTAYHLPIIQHSPNDEYMAENLGGLDETVKEHGVQGLHMAMAFWAFYADVQEEMGEALDSAIEKHEENAA